MKPHVCMVRGFQGKGKKLYAFSVGKRAIRISSTEDVERGMGWHIEDVFEHDEQLLAKIDACESEADRRVLWALAIPFDTHKLPTHEGL